MISQIFQNRYFKLALLTLGIAALIYLSLLLVLGALGTSLPNTLQVMVSLLAASLLVYKYLSQRIG